MNQALRQRLLAEAALRAAAHPADMDVALANGMQTVRRRYILTWVFALAAALALTAGVLLARGMLSTPGPATLESIAVSAPAQSLHPGITVTLSAVGRYSDGSTRPLADGVIWASSKQGVATVSAGGMVTAVAPGIADLTVTLDGVSGSLELPVLPPGSARLTALRITPGEAAMDPGGKLQFLAEGSYSDGSLGKLNVSAVWASSNPDIAAVDGDGLVTAAKPGTATISASEGGLQGTSVITVTVPPPAKVSGLSIDPDTLTLKEGQSAQLSAVASFTDGTARAVTNVTWATVPPQAGKIATVDASGRVTAHSLGTAAIRAVLIDGDGQQWQGQAEVTVERSVKSIVVSPAGPLQLQAGETTQLTATVFYSDGTTGKSVTWASSRPIYASVSQSGVVKGSFQGSTTVTASAEGVSSNPVSVAVGTLAPDPGPVKK